jgi:hypothetical protein
MFTKATLPVIPLSTVIWALIFCWHIQDIQRPQSGTMTRQRIILICLGFHLNIRSSVQLWCLTALLFLP